MIVPAAEAALAVAYSPAKENIYISSNKQIYALGNWFSSVLTNKGYLELTIYIKTLTNLNFMLLTYCKVFLIKNHRSRYIIHLSELDHNNLFRITDVWSHLTPV